MKECPKCSRVYADESMRFCLDDGASLLAPAGVQPTIRIPTAAKTEVLPGSPFSSRPRKSPLPWVIAALAVMFAGVVLVASLIVLIANRRSAADYSGPTRTRSASATPSPSSQSIVNLAGTRWKDTYATIAEKDYYFNPNGTINNSTHQTWRQNGNTVILEFNDGYARYEGTINGNRIDYKAHNTANFSWTAYLYRDEEPRRP
jgi:hypothetical protein